MLLENPNDFIDAYLRKIEDSSPDSSFHGQLGRQNLTSSIIDLLIAGTDTTSVTLTWAVLYMIKFPDIQKKVQLEIDQVIGRKRLPEMSDRFDD